MKTIGLIGGMSWESTLEYYRIINETVKEKLGKNHSAKCLLYSVDFAEVGKLQHEGKWNELAQLMVNAAQRLEKGDADFIIICANTMHKVAEDVQNNVNIPILHIVDAVAEKILAKGLAKVGLLGTKFTMEEDFYRGRLVEKHGLDVIIPSEADRQTIHRIIYEELCLGIVKDKSREAYLRIMDGLHKQGAEGIIEGCTEIVMLVRHEHTAIPLFDTTAIHAQEAVSVALA